MSQSPDNPAPAAAAAPRFDSEELWRIWRLLTIALLQREREHCHPYAQTRLEDAEAFMDDVYATVRMARDSAARMRDHFPGFPPAPPVAPK